MRDATIWGHVIGGQSRLGEGGLLQEYDPATGAKGFQIARGKAADVARLKESRAGLVHSFRMPTPRR